MKNITFSKICKIERHIIISSLQIIPWNLSIISVYQTLTVTQGHSQVHDSAVFLPLYRSPFNLCPQHPRATFSLIF